MSQLAGFKPLNEGRGGEDIPLKHLSILQTAIVDDDDVAQVIATNPSAVRDPDEDGNTPLFYAVNKDDVTATKILLINLTDVDVDTPNKNGDTVLHVAAREDRSKVMPFLLEKGDPAMPNGEGKAPIHIAALQGHTTIIKQLCDINADKIINLPLNQSTPSSTPLHLAIKAKQIKAALVLITRGASLEGEDEDGKVPLHLASELDYVDAELVKELVRLIIKKDKSACNVADKKGYTPLHAAVRNGRDKAVNMLLETYSTDPKLWEGFLELEASAQDGLMDLALDGGHQNVARSLVLSKFWEKFMMTGKMLDQKTRRTPMFRLIKDMPEVAKLVMDKCLETQGRGHIVARFEFLDDRFTTWGLPKDRESDEKPEVKKKLIKSSGNDKKDTTIQDTECSVVFAKRPFTSDLRALTKCHPMKVLAKTKNSQLLDHPLVRILLRRKWYRAAPVYLSFLVFYAVYIALICAYMTLTTPPHGKDLWLGGGGSGGGIGAVTRNGTNDSDGTMAPKLVQEYCTPSILVIYIFIWVCFAIGLATELLQMARMKSRYFLYLHNLCDWFTYISSALIVSRFSECGTMTKCRYQLGTICVFVSCLNLIYFIRVIPFLGIYVMMVVRMMRNFMRFFTIMFLFIITFGLCFFLLLQNQMPFSNLFFSIMKNWVMMVGEMDFTDVFHEHRESDNPNAEMYYEPLTWSLYILFLVFLSLIIMNLLTSLAVSGIDSLQEDSKYRMMALQIELSLNVELALPTPMQRRLGCVVRSQRLKTSVRRNKAVGKFWICKFIYKFFCKLKKWWQLFVYGDLCEEAMVKEALQIIQERKDEGNKEGVKKALTNNDVELAVIDKKVENIERHMNIIKDQISDMHAMVLKLTEGK